jgi:hypothetical protein
MNSTSGWFSFSGGKMRRAAMLLLALFSVAAQASLPTTLASPPQAVPSQTHRCQAVRQAVEEELSTQRRIPLLAVMDRVDHVCPHVEELARIYRKGLAKDDPARSIQVGHVDGHRILVKASGPSGSGHFWSVVAMTQVEGRLVAGCTVTSTAGWRNLPAEGARRLAPLDWFSPRGLLALWTSPPAFFGAAQNEHILLRRLYRIQGRALVLDARATLREVGTFSDLYARWARLPENGAAELHATTAEALGGVSEDRKCL